MSTRQEQANRGKKRKKIEREQKEMTHMGGKRANETQIKTKTVMSKAESSSAGNRRDVAKGCYISKEQHDFTGYESDGDVFVVVSRALATGREDEQDGVV